MRKLYYIANIRMPTERAHGIQIMEMCQAFADQGIDLELIVPARKTSINEEPFVFYNVRDNFKITKLWCLDTVKFGWLGFWIESLTFSMSILKYVVRKEGLFFTRDEIIALILRVIGKRMAWEAHMGQKNLIVRLIILLRVPVIAISNGLKEMYVRMGVHDGKIIVAPDAADIDRFDIDISARQAREIVNLPLDKKIILYKGSLGKWKGADTLAESSDIAETADLLFVFIGGTPEEVEKFKSLYSTHKRLLILGNRPRQETPIYQKAADLLVIPNSAKEDISKLYTSPMKLFGYMAGGIPILASDLPSLREILSDRYAYFFTADDPKSLSAMIDKIFVEYDEAQAKAREALILAKDYSWKKRAEKILDFIDEKSF